MEMDHTHHKPSMNYKLQVNTNVVVVGAAAAVALVQIFEILSDNFDIKTICSYVISSFQKKRI
jgi:hypothetical protein